jgi:trimeric autotransporter adhesin
MKKVLFWVLPLFGICLLFSLISHFQHPTTGSDDPYRIERTEEEEEEDGYDGPAQRDAFEAERLKDPALGYVPGDRLMNVVEDLHNMRHAGTMRVAGALTWEERGPTYDVVGPDGNPRGGTSQVAAGRVIAVFVDTLNDPTGNTVWAGGANGGLWKCTNFLTGSPNWQHIDDRFDNMAISSITQNPASPQTLYFSTGEPTSNADAVIGSGIWKSTNGGTTWSRLPSTTGFQRAFRVRCDGAGNIYVANRSSVLATTSGSGLYRSSDGGITWQNITPSPLTATNGICTDIEITAAGRFHASFGYAGSKVQHVYTDNPQTVSSANWNNSTGIRLSTASAYRLELAEQGNILYGVTIVSGNLDSAYKSTDGGATWTKQNIAAFSTSIMNGQGWYNLTLAINPNNSTEFIVGGLDAYKFTASGTATPTRLTYWVTTTPYVHADHHFIQWWKAGSESRLIMGTDGGVFYSSNGGSTFTDKNRNLAIKQFYSAAIHPAAGSNYMLAGAQDNGVHRFGNAGLSWTTEILGGDGCYVHISQANPQIQVGTYVYNSYHISSDGGTTWSDNDLSSDGLFVNPFDYDDVTNTMYACNRSAASNGQINRWANPHQNGPNTILTLTGLTRTTGGSLGYATAFKVSPFTRDRVYIGTSNGKVVRLDGGSTASAANINNQVTDISGAQIASGYVNSVSTGNSDDVLVATITSYGVKHVWYSSNGGIAWTAIDGNLPDIPVRWAQVDPQDDKKIYIATEAGVWYTDLVNGASTVWTNDINFPIVRTDMLKLRLSDNMLMAATHGRGVFTARLPSTPEVRFGATAVQLSERTTTTEGCRGYTDYTVPVNITEAPTGDATVQYSVQAGNTALSGSDFEISTTGTFGTPATQHIFPAGSSTPKTLTIRVYDDAEVESAETLKIGFSITGTTNAVRGAYNTYEISIVDNDLAPVLPGAGDALVGTGSYGSYVQPFRGSYAKSKSQYIYLASELRAAGLGAGNITGIAFNVTGLNSFTAYQGFTVGMKHTTLAVFPGISFESGATTCFSGNYFPVSGNSPINFSTPFNWDGVSNILVEFCYDNTTSPGADDQVTTSVTTGLMGIWNRVTTGTGCSLAAVYATTNGSNVRPNLTFKGLLTGNPVETASGATRTHSFGGSNGTVHYYSNAGKLMATLKSIDGFDYGCTQLTVDRAGTTALPFNNNSALNFVTAKTFHVSPATNNSSGQYTITLYYTEAEKAGWEAATGNVWDSIRIVKVKSQIGNYTPLNPAPDGPNGVEVVRPTLGRYGNDYTLTYTFASGFSGFAAGIVSATGGTTAVSGVDPDVTEIKLMPTVVRDATTLRVRSRRSMQIDWQVVDASGRVVSRFRQNVSAGINDVPLRFGRLAAGTYTITGQTGKGKTIIRFVRS